VETRLKNYQRELQENIALLNKSNLELEQFAYVASHDLQEPLRKISTFSDRLQIKYKPALPVDASQLIDRMVVAVARMRVLINDLLTFSRAGRIATENVKPVDMNQLLQNVIGDLELGLQEHRGTVYHDQLPDIEGSDTAFHQLFLNLLSNSIKFADPTRDLEIRIKKELLSGRETGVAKEDKQDATFCRFTIEDNGIGFDQAYAERIFLIFQRLHGVSEYKGTGIGLAICKKIVDSHHGYISAYGYPGKGATFVIVLPIKQ
jgi:Bacteriophytochrome (light-regulated signal transduction histidine kinase)